MMMIIVSNAARQSADTDIYIYIRKAQVVNCQQVGRFSSPMGSLRLQSDKLVNEGIYAI